MTPENLKGRKCIASYSGGKDSIFALYKAMQAGIEPIGLITAFNNEANRSWFHGITENLLQKVSASVALPVTLIRTTGEEYAENFEKALITAKDNGAEICVFGDIDIEDHLKWCSLRCEKAGLIPCFPLWGGSRKKLVYEFIDAGFSSVITIVDTKRMSKEFLGQTLDRELADAIEKSGSDICGENGEYHTFTFDGPLFSYRIDFTVKEKIERDNHAILAID